MPLDWPQGQIHNIPHSCGVLLKDTSDTWCLIPKQCYPRSCDALCSLCGLHLGAHLSIHLCALTQIYTYTLTLFFFFCLFLFVRPGQTYVGFLIRLNMRCVFAGCSWVPSIHTHATTTASITRWVNSKQEKNIDIEMYCSVNLLKFRFFFNLFLLLSLLLLFHAHGKLGAITQPLLLLCIQANFYNLKCCYGLL